MDTMESKAGLSAGLVYGLSFWRQDVGRVIVGQMGNLFGTGLRPGRLGLM